MKIVVTQEDIAHGKRACMFDCAVALALKRAGVKFIKLSYNEIITKVGPDGLEVLESIPLPPEATQFIVDFDDQTPVSPFEFEL